MPAIIAAGEGRGIGQNAANPVRAIWRGFCLRWYDFVMTEAPRPMSDELKKRYADQLRRLATVNKGAEAARQGGRLACSFSLTWQEIKKARSRFAIGRLGELI